MKSTTNIDLGENKAAYIKKIGRQLKEMEEKIQELEDIAEERGARDNIEIEKMIAGLQHEFTEVQASFESLTEDTLDSWPDQSRKVSTSYKKLEESIASVGTKLKRK